MRFRDFRSDGVWKFGLEMHPRLTVLAGLDAEWRERMAALFEAALHGRIAGLDARLDVEGRELELAEWADLIATGTIDGADPIVRAADVPATAVVELPRGDVEDGRADESPAEQQLATVLANRAAASSPSRLAGGGHDGIGSPPTGGPSEEAARLLAALDALEEQRNGARTAAPAWLVTSARAALEEARAELSAALEAGASRRFDDDDVADLEAAHQTVIDAEERAARPLIGAAARRRLRWARQAEQEALVRLGVQSYGDYLLESVGALSSAGAGARIAQARRALADAEAVWDELQLARPSSDPELLERAEADWRAAAATVLGEDLDPHAALSAIGRRLRRLAAPTAESRPATADGRAADVRVAPMLDPEEYILGRFEAVRSVDGVGSLPVVLVEPFVDLHERERDRVLALVARLSESVQVVYLTDQPEVIAWAQGLGRERSVLRRFGRSVS